MSKKIPILMYHAIEPEGSSMLEGYETFYNVTPGMFGRQMSYLEESGFTTISIKDLLGIQDDKDLPEKPIMLTFDDGHISHFTRALPILKEHGLAGLFFLVVNDIGAKDRISWNEARELLKSGMEIGSHSMNHKILNHSFYENLIPELKASKLTLEDELNANIVAYSIPRGLYSDKISEVARGMGYRLVFTSFSGNATLASNPYCLKRFVIRNDYTMKEFVSIVNNDPVFMVKNKLEQFAKNGIQKTIGVKSYDTLKKLIFTKV